MARINLTENFATVFLDNGYWNKAIAASPAHALPGYVAGGLAWFAIPWLAATTMGMAIMGTDVHLDSPKQLSDSNLFRLIRACSGEQPIIPNVCVLARYFREDEADQSLTSYPNRMDPADVKAGLPLPYAAVALLGSKGAAATLVLVFMAVTSAMSAELIAVSTICTYDIYKVCCGHSDGKDRCILTICFSSRPTSIRKRVPRASFECRT